MLLKEGIYDEKEIKLEIEAVFIKKGKTIEQKLLYTDFWDLENDTIEKGFPRVLDKAYKGELNRDNYVRLIRLIMFLLYYGAISPKEYDANKIVLGWENRVNKLIEKGIEDDPLHIAIFDKAELLKIDKTLYELYKEIELHEIELMSTKGKKFLLYNIKNPNKVEKYDSRAILIDKLDQEIIDLFIDRYSSLGNYDRIIITRDICDISIDTHDNSEIIIDSICKRYQSLIDGLNSIKKDNDIMGCCTIKESITMLTKKISEYSKLISDRKEQ